ncbi:hypothetical protein GQ53DRAFT_836003 [Thozetella sp. PMI_491]|nr:hypothetical protein GQ53DRAFT_836003 [Thozetella sp. PMI_491]
MRSSSALLLLVPGVVATRHNVVHDSPPPEDEEPRLLSHFRWHNPFYEEGDTAHEHYDVQCTVEDTIYAKQYKISDLDVDFPAGLAPWKKAMQPFLMQDYPGSWRGVDPGRTKRDLIMMEYHDVPAPVREWVEEQHRIPYNDKIWLLGIFGKPKVPEGNDKDAKPVAEEITANMFDAIPASEKVLIFAPGAMYEVLPLFVAKKAEDPSCESELRNLEKYNDHMKDDVTVAYPIEVTEPTEKNGKAITIKIKAQHIKESDHGRNMRTMWERVYRAAHRQNRKMERAERDEKKRKMEAGIMEDDEDDYGHDEL